MYEENENKINWSGIIKKIIILIAAVLVIFGIITMINKCSNDDVQDPTIETPISLTEQLDAMESATLKYLTKENLPTELNASKTIRLKILINNDLIASIADSEGNKCDVNESYSEVTRLENNYAVKLQVYCGHNSAYRVIYVGCFESCDGGICKGSENSTSGICSLGSTTDDETSTNTNTNTNTSTTTKPSTSKPSTSKPSTGNTSNNNANSSTGNTSNNTSNNNSSNTNTNTNTNVNTNKKETMYQYKKCTTKQVCEVGTIGANGDCEIYKHVTLIGKVLTTGGETVTYHEPVAATPVVKESTVYFSNSSKAKNTSTITYVFKKYVPGKGYEYKKYEKKYECTTGIPSGEYCLVPKTKTMPIKKSCEDRTYTYTESTGKCTKVVLQKSYATPVPETTCETTWSYSTSLKGWTKTGLTK